jgi:ectonucleotide pyrophosphatase/phosphodiesterase family member 5
MKNLLITLFLLLSRCSPPLVLAQGEARHDTAPEQTVVLISFDGFRWDYRFRGLTPTLDSLATAGVSALSLRPCFPSLTFPNHIAIVTGMFPQNHGIINNVFTNPMTGAWYAINKTALKRQADWYTGEALWETARKNGLKTASYAYPSSDLDDSLRLPTYLKPYNPGVPLNDRIDTILAWLQLPEHKRPRLVCAYVETVDIAGHETGVTSATTNAAIMQADRLVGRLCAGIREAELENVNIIICSDHGMTDISRERSVIMKQHFWDIPHKSFGSSETMQFQSVQKNPAADTILYHALKSREFHFRVYWKDSVPAWYGALKHAFVMPIVCVADRGWILDDGSYKAMFDGANDTKAKHGWDADWLDMNGIFVASGEAFQQNYQTGTMRNVDIAPLVCRVLNIPNAPHYDGDLRKVGFLLTNPFTNP